MKRSLHLIIILLVLPLTATAQTPEDKGLAIIREADRRDTGFGDFTAELRMILKNKHGKESERAMRSRSLEVEGDGDKSLAVFDAPRDIKGTAFLTFSHKVGDDDQWIYLPALKRVKRISASNKSGSFMGSEFAYEDLASQEVEKYTYKWIRDEVYEGKSCFVVEYQPVDKQNSGYTRLLVWLDKDEYRSWKVDYYDRKNVHLKTLVYADYKQYLGRYWRAHEMRMDNHQSGKSTTLYWTGYSFRSGLKDRDFTTSSLKRIR